jgi:HlyD family secretion protein
MNMRDGQTASVEEFLGIPPRSGRARRRRLATAAAGCILLLVFLGWYAGSGPDAPRYATVALKRGDMSVHVTATGNLVPTNEVSVGSELSGLIDTVYVDINDRVKKGQALAQIDTEKLQDAIRRSEAALEQARAAVLQADASLDLARA